MRMSPWLGSPCWYAPSPEGAPSSGTTTRLMLVLWAQTWAARRISPCQRPLSAGLLLKAEERLLAAPPRLVPSGMKLMVIVAGFSQALPVAEYSTRRDSSDSSTGRLRLAAGRRDGRST